MALIYAVNTNSQSLVVGDTVNFESVARRCGCGYNVAAGNILTSIKGLHKISTNLTFAAGAAGVFEVALYKNGIAIPGATASVTVTDAAVAHVSLADVVTKLGCCEGEITAVITGIPVTVTNATITVRS